jgi:hypothetical protein
MVFKDTCDGRRIDRPYLVFARMADLSSCSINIRHKGLLRISIFDIRVCRWRQNSQLPKSNESDKIHRAPVLQGAR